MLPKRRLGNTGYEVSCLALGGLSLASRYAWGKTPEIVRRAAELGINCIDTSPSYFDSEDELGRALQQVDAEFIIGTKMGRLPPASYPAQDADFLRSELEKSFQALHRDKIELLYIHEPDRPDLHDWWVDKEHYEGPVLDLLKEYQDKGKIGTIGLGGTTTVEMAHLLDTGKFGVVLSAFQYSLLWREAQDSVFPAAQRVDAGIICGSPMQQGVLSRVFRKDVTERTARWLSEPRRRQFLRLYDFVDGCGLSLPELALRFVISNPNVSAVLTGVNSVEQLEKNVEAVSRGPLPEAFLRELDDIYAMVPFRPYEEPFALFFKEAEKVALANNAAFEAKRKEMNVTARA